MRALGVDVGGRRKGLDLVVLDDHRDIVVNEAHLAVDDLAAIIRKVKPDVIAIDSPPAPALRGRSRRAERDLGSIGIHSYATPSEAGRFIHPFYEWMTIGFSAFAAAEGCGFPRYGSGPVLRSAIEVFPHATVVVLNGCLPPARASKRRWRSLALESRGVGSAALRSVDQVDAALAALTGLLALEGDFHALGDPHEGVIVLPVREAIESPYRRCDPDVLDGQEQAPLPGMSRCRCGDPACTLLTNGEFAPGHDAKRKSILWALARAGGNALGELETRGWLVPPEMR